MVIYVRVYGSACFCLTIAVMINSQLRLPTAMQSIIFAISNNCNNLLCRFQRKSGTIFNKPFDDFTIHLGIYTYNFIVTRKFCYWGMWQAILIALRLKL